MEEQLKELGHTCRDVVTGFVGVAIGKVFYATGCNQVLLSPKVDKDGKCRDSQWFDEQRIEIMDDPRIVTKNVNPGFGPEAPRKN